MKERLKEDLRIIRLYLGDTASRYVQVRALEKSMIYIMLVLFTLMVLATGDILFKYYVAVRCIWFFSLAALACGCVANVVWVLLKRIKKTDCAVIIEKEDKMLQSQLITLSDCYEPGWNIQPHEEIFIEKMAQEVREKLGNRKILQNINKSKIKKTFLHFLIFIIFFLIAVCFFDEFYRVTINRIIHPFQLIQPPSFTMLKIMPGDCSVPEHINFVIHADLARGKCRKTKVKIFNGQDIVAYDMERVAEKQFRFTLYNVTSGFTYQVSGGDFKSQHHKVNVFIEPRFEELSIQLIPPSYTGLEKCTFDGIRESINAWEGTQVLIEGKANIPLSEAIAVVGTDKEYNLKILPGGNNVQGSFFIYDNSQVTFFLRDQKGNTACNPPQMYFHVKKDALPEIHIERRNIYSRVMKTTEVPLSVKVLDDYGVSKVKMTVFAMGNIKEERVLAEYDLPIRAGEVKFELYLEDYNVKVGNVVFLFIDAYDNNDVTGPGVCTSEVLNLEVRAYRERYKGGKYSIGEEAFCENPLNIFEDILAIQKLIFQEAWQILHNRKTAAEQDIAESINNIKLRQIELIGQIENIFRDMEVQLIKSGYANAVDRLVDLKKAVNCMDSAVCDLGRINLPGAVKNMLMAMDLLNKTRESVFLIVSSDTHCRGVKRLRQVFEDLNRRYSKNLEKSKKRLESENKRMKDVAGKKKIKRKIDAMVEKTQNVINCCSDFEKEAPSGKEQLNNTSNMIRELLDEAGELGEALKGISESEEALRIFENAEGKLKQASESFSNRGFIKSRESLENFHSGLRHISSILDESEESKSDYIGFEGEEYPDEYKELIKSYFQDISEN